MNRSFVTDRCSGVTQLIESHMGENEGLVILQDIKPAIFSALAVYVYAETVPEDMDVSFLC